MILSLICIFSIAAKAEAALRNPVVVKDSSITNAGQKTTWDCVWFGSYPQTEIVDKAESSEAYGKLRRRFPGRTVICAVG